WIATGLEPIDSRHPWRSRCTPPAAFAFAILQTQSGSVCDGAAAGPGMMTWKYASSRSAEGSVTRRRTRRTMRVGRAFQHPGFRVDEDGFEHAEVTFLQRVAHRFQLLLRFGRQ